VFDYVERFYNRKPSGGGRLASLTAAMLTVLMDILTDSHQVHRLEVVDSGRRRRWTEAAKLKIVQESLSGLASRPRQRAGIGYRASFS